jgi:hypothetical protein
MRKALERAVLDSPLGPRLRSWRADFRERELQRALTRPVQSAVVADVLYRVLVGRPASRPELEEMHRQAASGRSILELAQELRETVDGSRRTVNSTNLALRTWLRTQFEAGQTEFATPRLVFMHFMRVGGTSMSDQLARWFGEGRARVHVYLDDIALIPPPALANCRVIAGHIPYAGLALIPGSFRTMAVLRDPFERTLSHYAHLRDVNPRFSDLTLEEFVFAEHMLVSGNHQARYLAHDTDLANAWRTYSPEARIAALGGDPSAEHVLQDLFETGAVETPDDELLRRASANLERIDIVGITEQLDTAAEQVASLFGFPPVALGRLNPSPPADRPAIEARIRRRIDERTAVDRELYDLARKRVASASPARP